MKIHEPETPYEKMMFVALVKKLRANHKPKKKSQRDERREWNKNHPNVQLPMRPKTGKASFHTHEQHHYFAVNWEDFSLTFVNERRPIARGLQDSD